MVADVLIAAGLATKRSGGEEGDAAFGVQFIPAEELAGDSAKREPFHWSTTVNGRRVGLVPDGVFAIETGEAADAKSRIICLLEADRGTMPITRRSAHLSSTARNAREARVSHLPHAARRAGRRRAGACRWSRFR